MVSGRQRKYIFAQESFYLQGILKDINEEETSFLDCKHKHMINNGASPDKFGVLHRLYSMISQAELVSKGYQSLVPITISFLEKVWVPLIT